MTARHTKPSGREPLDVEAVLPEVARISDMRLRGQVIGIWRRCWRESAFERIEDVPVSAAIAHPHLPHNRAVMRAALALAEIYADHYGCDIDHDVLLGAGLLQDVSKLVEYAPGPEGAVRTPLALSVPHPTYAVHLALAADVDLRVVHAIAAHTPDGSVEPRTLEAWILRYVDQADVAALGGSRWHQKVVHYRQG